MSIFGFATEALNLRAQTIKELREENKVLKEAVRNYFEVWANKGKKPGWCQRTEEAKSQLLKLTKLK